MHLQNGIVIPRRDRFGWGQSKIGVISIVFVHIVAQLGLCREVVLLTGLCRGMVLLTGLCREVLTNWSL